MFEGVNLKWNDFEDNLVKCFKDSRSILNDVTIFCGSDKVTANKFVLCASSEIFREILVDNELSLQQQNCTLLLWDVEITMMNLVLDFIYYGEVQVTEEKLNDFLFLAKRLRVKGLIAEESNQNQTETNNQKTNNRNQSNGKTGQTNIMGDSSSERIAFKRKTIPDFETSPKNIKPNRLDNANEICSGPLNKEIIDLDDSIQNTHNSTKVKSESNFFTGKQAASNIIRPNPLNFLHQSSIPDLEPIDGAIDHPILVDTCLDSFDNSVLEQDGYKCNLCLKTYKTKGSLYNHMSLYHRGQKSE